MNKWQRIQDERERRKPWWSRNWPIVAGLLIAAVCVAARYWMPGNVQ